MAKFSKTNQPTNRNGGRPLKGGRVGAALKEFLQADKLTYKFIVTDSKGNDKEYEGQIKNNGGTIAQLIAMQLIAKAAAGDIKAIRELIDRTEGRAKQSMQLESDLLAGNIQIVFSGSGVPPVRSEQDIKDIKDDNL